MNGLATLEPDYSEFVEVDPTGRYGRYNEILGKGASKTVYRAFDEYEGIEVAWNQVKLYDFLQSPEDLERLYCEIHLLKTLKHKNIMKFYTSWVDTANRNINFVTELFTSGTLRQYRQKHKRVNIRAVKHWCRQILKGLLYLHSREPPVIHRDLKCDNIFVNGHQGEVKIGDLGLAAILRKSHAAHCVGTPEFMAPEVFEEEYNELVDIYSFGMCILEMITFEYPYSECTHPAQIYKKVITGRKPDALYKVEDPEVRNFIEKCLATVTLRLSARELLSDPFLQIDDCVSDLSPIDCRRKFDDVGPLLMQPRIELHSNRNLMFTGYSGDLDFDADNGCEYLPLETAHSGIELFTYQEEGDEHSANIDISIRGKRREDGSIFLRLRITDQEGRIRNIYFPFDVETDTALSVATEMVAELDITDQDVTKIADMMDGEIASLVPGWKPGPGIEETPSFASANLCHNCASNCSSYGSLMDYLSRNPDAKNLQPLQCSGHGCIHGRFEEITYQVGGSGKCVTDSAPMLSSQCDGVEYRDNWASQGSEESRSDEEMGQLAKQTSGMDGRDGDRELHMDNQNESNARNSVQGYDTSSTIRSPSCAFSDDYENEIGQELRWLKAKYQMELRELRDQQLGVVSKSSSLFPHSNSSKMGDKRIKCPLVSTPIRGVNDCTNSPTHFEKGCLSPEIQSAKGCEATFESSSPESIVTAKSFYSWKLLPSSLHRTTSLPVDAVDV